MKIPINWTWMASEDPSQEAGEITITVRSHVITFEMESFIKASKLIRLIEQLQVQSRDQCISTIMGYMHDGFSRVRNEP